MEHDFHRWLKDRCRLQDDRRVVVGVGDDGAILSPTDRVRVIATDSIAEGTHFDLALTSLDRVGRKSLAVNLSDLAAMAARPDAALLTLQLPRKFQLEDAQQIVLGFEEVARQFDVAIIGGDTNVWDGPLVVGATAIGSRASELGGWSLDGAQSGDLVLVSGSFGGSINGRHLTFEPRVDLALALAAQFPIRAATDASDSLAVDLNLMATHSLCGVNLELAKIPIASDVETDAADVGLSHALYDGEDFELILAVEPSVGATIMAEEEFSEQLTVIGSFTDSHRELRSVQPDGTWAPVPIRGYVH